jgi:zinc protease
VSATAIDGVPLAEVEAAATASLDEAAADGVSEREVAKAKSQLRARLVFENDSVTNLAHQLGYFQTVATLDLYKGAAARIAAVTGSDVNRVAGKYLRRERRTVGWFNPGNGAGR